MLTVIERMRLIEATVDRPDWFTADERASRIAEATEALRSKDDATSIAAAETLIAMDAVNLRRATEQARGGAPAIADDATGQSSRRWN